MKEPSLKDLSLFLEVDESLLIDVLRCQERVKSLDEVVSDDGKTLTLLDQIADTYNDSNLYLDNISLKEACVELGFLTPEKFDEVFHPEQMV